ncbi:MAG: hypothetical protein WAK40_03505 [Thermoplasmata archaeon]
MIPTRAARPVCEVDRAYRELIGRPPAETTGGSNACSPEAPEPRSFPAAPAGEKEYILCNGHLRDLFDEQAKLSSLNAHPPSH